MKNHPPQNRDNIYNPEEREAMLVKMKQASNAFYGAAAHSGCHAFLEFTGLMNEFIKMCERAHRAGLDFNTTNQHCGKVLPMEPYEAKYLGEKLGCIYGNALQDPELARIFKEELGLPENPVKPPPKESGRLPTDDRIRLLEKNGRRHYLMYEPWVDSEVLPNEKALAAIHTMYAGQIPHECPAPRTGRVRPPDIYILATNARVGGRVQTVLYQSNPNIRVWAGVETEQYALSMMESMASSPEEFGAPSEDSTADLTPQNPEETADLPNPLLEP